MLQGGKLNLFLSKLFFTQTTQTVTEKGKGGGIVIIILGSHFFVIIKATRKNGEANASSK